jgi:hypothetical protein
VTVIELRRRELGKAGLGEFDAVEFEERRCDGMEAEGIAFLQDNAGKLAPNFNDEGLGHRMDHGLNLLFEVEMVTIRRLSNGGGCQIFPFIQQIPSVRHQYGGRIFSALALSST